MPLGVFFWVLFVVFLVAAVYFRRERLPDVLALFALFFVLGWKVFGFIIQ